MIRATYTAIFGYDYFLSYAHSDAADYAAALKHALEQADYRVFLDQQEAPAGARLRRVLRLALRSSSAFVLLDSPAAARSRYVRIELRYARRYRIPILPVALGGTVAQRPEGNHSEVIRVEERPDALAAGRPSTKAVTALIRTVALRRRNAVRRTWASVAVAAVATAGAVALWKGIEAQQRAVELRDASLVARVAASPDPLEAALVLGSLDPDRIPERAVRTALDLLSQPIPARRYVGDGRPLRSALPLADGRRVLLEAFDDAFWIYDRDSGDELLAFVPETTKRTRGLFDPRPQAPFARVGVASPSDRVCTLPSRDGKTIVTLFRDGRRRGVSIASGEVRFDRPSEIAANPSGLALAPFACRALSIGQDGAFLWELDAEGPPARLEAGAVVRASLSPDGGSAVLATRDRRLLLWNETKGDVQRIGDRADVTDIAFNADGAFAGIVGPESIRVWATSDWSAPTELPTRGFAGQKLAISPDGEFLAVATADGSVLLQRPLPSSRPAPLAEGRGAVDGLWFDPTGRYVLDLAEGRLRARRADAIDAPLELAGHSPGVTDARFDPQTGTVFTAGLDGEARRWELGANLQPSAIGGRFARMVGARTLEGGDVVRVIHDDGWVADYAFSEPDPVRKLAQLPGEYYHRAWISADGSTCVTQPGVRQVHIGRFVAPEDRLDTLTVDLPEGELVTAAALDPHGRFVVFAHGRVVGTAMVGSAYWMETRDPESRRPLAENGEGILATAVDSTGTRALVGDREGRVELFEIADQGPIQSAGSVELGSQITVLTFDPEGHRILVATHDGRIEVGTWNAAWKPEFELSLHPDRASAARFANASDRLLVGTAGGALHWLSLVDDVDPLVFVGEQPVLDVEIAGDSSSVTAFFKHNDVRRWLVTWPALLDTVRAATHETLTPDEERALLLR